MQHCICFDEYPYHSTYNLAVYPVVVDGVWWLDGAVYQIEEIGKMCDIPEDELIFMKLKYGG